MGDWGIPNGQSRKQLCAQQWGLKREALCLGLKRLGTENLKNIQSHLPLKDHMGEPQPSLLLHGLADGENLGLSSGGTSQWEANWWQSRTQS